LLHLATPVMLLGETPRKYEMLFQFEWDEAKAKDNLEKHGISFEEAITVFGDPHSLTIHDANHSVDEDRYIDLGKSAGGHLLVVVYTERGESIRLISCREATAREQGHYERRIM
jgi:uncharacterized DUF497 family protein